MHGSSLSPSRTYGEEPSALFQDEGSRSYYSSHAANASMREESAARKSRSLSVRFRLPEEDTETGPTGVRHSAVLTPLSRRLSPSRSSAKELHDSMRSASASHRSGGRSRSISRSDTEDKTERGDEAPWKAFKERLASLAPSSSSDDERERRGARHVKALRPLDANVAASTSLPVPKAKRAARRSSSSLSKRASDHDHGHGIHTRSPRTSPSCVQA